MEEVHDIGGDWKAQFQGKDLCLFKGKEALYLSKESVETLKKILNGVKCTKE